MSIIAMPEWQVREEDRAMIVHSVRNAPGNLVLQVSGNQVALSGENEIFYTLSSFQGGLLKKFSRARRLEVVSDVLSACGREGYDCSRLAKIGLCASYIPRGIELTLN